MSTLYSLPHDILIYIFFITHEYNFQSVLRDILIKEHARKFKNTLFHIVLRGTPREGKFWSDVHEDLWNAPMSNTEIKNFHSFRDWNWDFNPAYFLSKNEEEVIAEEKAFARMTELGDNRYYLKWKSLDCKKKNILDNINEKSI